MRGRQSELVASHVVEQAAAECHVHLAVGSELEIQDFATPQRPRTGIRRRTGNDRSPFESQAIHARRRDASERLTEIKHELRALRRNGPWYGIRRVSGRGTCQRQTTQQQNPSLPHVRMTCAARSFFGGLT